MWQSLVYPLVIKGNDIILLYFQKHGIKTRKREKFTAQSTICIQGTR